MAEPAEEDVSQLTADRLAAIITRKGYDQSVAWTIGDALVAAGVTLPPEPDTPPEPQERFRPSGNLVLGEDAAPYYARGCTGAVAIYLARLLNLDAKYEDRGGVAGVIESVDSEARDARLAAKLQSERASNAEAEAGKQQRRAEDFKAHLKERVNQRDEARDEVERLTSHVEHWKNEAEYTQERVDKLLAEVERLQDKASARAVKATELALEDARAELIREREDRGLERDLFAARVKELETELNGLLGRTPHRPEDR